MDTKFAAEVACREANYFLGVPAMMSLFTSGLLLCSGMTNTFDAHLVVDQQNKSVKVTMKDLDATYGSFDVAFDGLNEVDGCLVSDEIKICISPSKNEATLKVTLRDQYAIHVEEGMLDCELKNSFFE